MGSGALKTLLSYKVSKDQFLYIFPRSSHSPKPCVGLLLWRLRTSDGNLFIDYTPVIDDCFTSLTRTWGPTWLIVPSSVPRMLGAVATQMSLFMTGVTLNFS